MTPRLAPPIPHRAQHDEPRARVAHADQPLACCPGCGRGVRRLHRVRHDPHTDWEPACATCAAGVLASRDGSSYGGTLLLRHARRAS